LASVAAKRGFVNFGIGNVPGAISDFDRMLAAARRAANRPLEGAALGYRGMMEVLNNDWEGAEATLRTAWAIVDEGFEEVRPLANLGLVWLMFTANRIPEAEPLLLTADEVAALPDPFLEGTWNWILGFFEYWWGHPSEALRILGGMSEAASRVVFNRLWNWWPASLSLATRGDYESALGLLERMEATCERVGDVLVRPRVLNTVGWIYSELQDHEGALKWNRSSVEFIQRLPAFPNPDVEMHARLNVGDNLVALGRPEEAEEQFRTVEAVARSPVPADRWMAWRYSQHLFHSYGELCLARGDRERALAYADECLEVAEYNSSMKNVVKGRRLRGQVLIAQDRLDDAEQELSTALEVAHEVGNPPQLWKTHAAIANLRRAQGRTEDARRSYGEAVSIIDGVAASLTDDQLRETFLESAHVQGIRQAAKSAS
jgi:tetratricopeptide (TPR) repeat protein